MEPLAPTVTAAERGEALVRLWKWLSTEVPGGFCHPALQSVRSGFDAEDWGCAVAGKGAGIAAGTTVLTVPSGLCSTFVRGSHADLIRASPEPDACARARIHEYTLPPRPAQRQRARTASPGCSHTMRIFFLTQTLTAQAIEDRINYH